MPKPNPIYIPKPFSLVHSRSAFSGSDPRKLAAMTALMPWDYFHRTYEFEEPTMVPQWVSNVTAGGAPTAFAYNAQRNSGLQGATGTTDDGVVELVYHAALFDPSDNPMVWFRFIAPAAVSGFSFEIGLSDPRTAALPGVTDVDTPATGNAVTDMAAVHMDTDQTLTTAALVADGTTGAALKTDISPVWTPTVNGIIDVIVGVRPNLANCWIWDQGALVGNRAHAVAQGPDAGVLVMPYALFRTRNTTTKTISILKAVIVAEENRTT